VWQSAPGWAIFSVILLVVQGFFPLAQLYLLKLFVDEVTLVIRSSIQDFDRIIWLTLYLGGITLLGALAGSLATLVGDVQGQIVNDYIASIIHEKSVTVDLAYYENSQYYDLLHRAQQESSYRPTQMLNNLTLVGQNSLALFALVGLLLSMQWMIAAALFVATLPGTLIRLRHSQRVYAWQLRRTPTERQARYFQWMMMGEQHAKEIRLFGLGALFIERFNDLRATLRHEKLCLARRLVLVDFLTQFAGMLVVFWALGFSTLQAVKGVMTVGDLVVCYQAFQRGQSCLRDVLGGLANLYEDSLFLAGLYEFLDLKPNFVAPASPQKVPQPIERGIKFENLRFEYPDSPRPILDGITMTIRPGEHIALVAANGAGKTTLVKLLCRLYDPTSGRITIDGIDLRQFDPADLRRQISITFQDYAHYHLTLRENIWLGNLALEPSDKKIEIAAHEAGSEALLKKLPHGYNTRLGKWFNDGYELSIGEWQKIALARTFVRNAQIIVLDEPTSALDASAEFEVFQKFRLLAAGRTTILISHRLSTVKMVDTIYVMGSGKIIESGSHAELMRFGGEYARMFRLQSENYL
jgi:ATP-binding cassette subfamily B protein